MEEVATSLSYIVLKHLALQICTSENKARLFVHENHSGMYECLTNFSQQLFSVSEFLAVTKARADPYFVLVCKVVERDSDNWDLACEFARRMLVAIETRLGQVLGRAHATMHMHHVVTSRNCHLQFFHNLVLALRPHFNSEDALAYTDFSLPCTSITRGALLGLVKASPMYAFIATLEVGDIMMDGALASAAVPPGLSTDSWSRERLLSKVDGLAYIKREGRFVVSSYVVSGNGMLGEIMPDVDAHYILDAFIISHIMNPDVFEWIVSLYEEDIRAEASIKEMFGHLQAVVSSLAVHCDSKLFPMANSLQQRTTNGVLEARYRDAAAACSQVVDLYSPGSYGIRERIVSPFTYVLAKKRASLHPSSISGYPPAILSSDMVMPDMWQAFELRYLDVCKACLGGPECWAPLSERELIWANILYMLTPTTSIGFPRVVTFDNASAALCTKVCIKIPASIKEASSIFK
jgi:hypothetical protein